MFLLSVISKLNSLWYCLCTFEVLVLPFYTPPTSSFYSITISKSKGNISVFTSLHFFEFYNFGYWLHCRFKVKNKGFPSFIQSLCPTVIDIKLLFLLRLLFLVAVISLRGRTCTPPAPPAPSSAAAPTASAAGARTTAGTPTLTVKHVSLEVEFVVVMVV